MNLCASTRLALCRLGCMVWDTKISQRRDSRISWIKDAGISQRSHRRAGSSAQLMRVGHMTLSAHQQPCGHLSRVLGTHKDKALHGERDAPFVSLDIWHRFVFRRSCPNKLQGAVKLLAQVKDVLFLCKLF